MHDTYLPLCEPPFGAADGAAHGELLLLLCPLGCIARRASQRLPLVPPPLLLPLSDMREVLHMSNTNVRLHAGHGLVHQAQGLVLR